MHHGSCLCGAVSFSISAALNDPVACHCKQCRQQSGHYFAAAHAPEADVVFANDEGLAWYRASDSASRGFCRTCGSSLFWRSDKGGEIAIALGALDEPTGLKLGRHVWVRSKGDYYRIGDGLPQEQEFEG